MSLSVFMFVGVNTLGDIVKSVWVRVTLLVFMVALFQFTNASRDYKLQIWKYISTIWYGFTLTEFEYLNGNISDKSQYIETDLTLC